MHLYLIWNIFGIGFCISQLLGFICSVTTYIYKIGFNHSCIFCYCFLIEDGCPHIVIVRSSRYWVQYTWVNCTFFKHAQACFCCFNSQRILITINKHVLHYNIRFSISCATEVVVLEVFQQWTFFSLSD